ncbi:MAG: ribonuclease III [Elusimicrobia bacterium]|nr:ribonuclease III [Elusimicrobiota bacterium]
MDSDIEREIKYAFKNKELLKNALTHKSYAIERNLPQHNERLEFLGDSVLGLVVSVYLFMEHPDKDEGYLSKIKSVLVSRNNLTRWAKELNLGEHLYLGMGEMMTGGKKRSSILCNSLEALIGALYFDGGTKETERFIMEWLGRQTAEEFENDYKSSLQEIIQRKHKTPPEYEILRTEGPEHDKTFTIRVKIGKKILGIGTGKNKKEAQQSAAKNALSHIAINNPRL